MRFEMASFLSNVRVLWARFLLLQISPLLSPFFSRPLLWGLAVCNKLHLKISPKTLQHKRSTVSQHKLAQWNKVTLSALEIENIDRNVGHSRAFPRGYGIVTYSRVLFTMELYYNSKIQYTTVNYNQHLSEYMYTSNLYGLGALTPI
jgi:hypothetical protein